VDDQALARRARSGDEVAFAELVQRHQQATFNVAHHLLRDYDGAAAAAREALVRLYLALPELDRSQPTGPWLLNAVRGQCAALSARGEPTDGADLSPTHLAELAGSTGPALPRGFTVAVVEEAMRRRHVRPSWSWLVPAALVFCAVVLLAVRAGRAMVDGGLIAALTSLAEDPAAYRTSPLTAALAIADAVPWIELAATALALAAFTALLRRLGGLRQAPEQAPEQATGQGGA
jgi:hypothetical protein